MKKVAQVFAFVFLLLLLSGQGVPLHRAALAHPALTLGVLLLAAWAVTGTRNKRLHQGVDWIFRLPRLHFNLLLFVVAGGAYALIAGVLFKGIPRIDDGMAALFQARLFARGVLSLPLPADAAFYEVFGVLGNRADLGHWCGMYPPGWPLVLTPGVWLGVPWLVNPVLGGLLVVTISELGRNFYTDRTGRLAALLAIPSPLIAVLSGLHLSHLATVLACALCLLSLRKLWETRRWIWGGAAGLLWGIGFLCRPLDAAVLGAVFALGFLLPPRRLLHCKGGIMAGLAMAVLAMGLLFGFQKATTGDAMTPGHKIGMKTQGEFGFVTFDAGRSHTPAKGFQHILRRLRVLNDGLLGWPIPALLLVMLPFVLGRARSNGILLLLPMPALLLVYACFWYYEAEAPARYISGAFPFLFVLASRGLLTLREMLASHGRWVRLPAFLVVSGTLFLAISTPEHFKQYTSSYYDVEDLLPRVVRDYDITQAIVFMDAIGRDPVREDCFNDYYSTGFMRNDLDLDGDVLYVRNLREHNIGMVQRHPDRTAWLYRYRRDFGKAVLYRIVLKENDLRLIPVEPATPDLVVAPDPG